MRNEVVQTFEHSLFGSLHTFTDANGAPWFVGKQVANKLGYEVDNTDALTHTLRRHCPDKKQVQTLSETLSVLPQGVRVNSVLISEADLYRLVMNSNMSGAVAFQDWVVNEVLPSIREHGGYFVEQPTMAEQRANPELMESINNQFVQFRTEMVAMIPEIISQTVAAALSAVSQVAAPVVQPTAYQSPWSPNYKQPKVMAEDAGNRIDYKRLEDFLKWAEWPFEEQVKTTKTYTRYAPRHTLDGVEMRVNDFVDWIYENSKPSSDKFNIHSQSGFRYKVFPDS